MDALYAGQSIFIGRTDGKSKIDSHPPYSSFKWQDTANNSFLYMYIRAES